MRVVFGVLFVGLMVLAVAMSGFGQTGTLLKYDDYGFSVTIPDGAQPVSLRDLGGGGMQRAYMANELSYVVVATNDVGPRGMGARASIDMVMEIMNAVGPKIPSITYRSVTAATKQGVTAKGYVMSGEAQTGNMRSTERVPVEILSKYGNHICVGLMAVPLSEAPPMVGVLVVLASASQQAEVESQLTQAASTFTFFQATGAWARPKSKAASSPPAPPVKSINQLKKGQIELVGVVKSTDAAAKSVDMLVTQAVPFSGNGVMISPPRLKRVYAKEIAEGVKEGAVIIVVGGDTGPGKSVTADTLTVMDASKLGF